MENFTMLQYFEWYYPADGSLWRKFAAEARRLKELGIDSVWLPPAHKGMDGIQSTGYDSYDLYDLGEFEQKGSVRTKYGTKEEFINAVKSGQEAGLQVYADIVLNHLGGGDETEVVVARKVDPWNRNEFISEAYEIEAYTKFTYPGRHGMYSDFVWDQHCFSGVDYDERTGETAIFSIQNEYGEGWEDVLDQENGNYDYLMLCDIDFRNPHVREEIKRWGKWFQQCSGVNGFRLDAIKHIVPGFFNEWLDHLRGDSGQELFTVGEYWAPANLAGMLEYIEETGGRISLFDATLQAKFSEASKLGSAYDLSQILDGTLVQARPDLAVTLVENHDTQPLQSLEQVVERWFRSHAYAIILLREAGYPCVFYTDIYGSSYTDKGQDGIDYQVTLFKLDEIELLLELRKKKAYGMQRDYFDHANCVGWTRAGLQDQPESGMAVLLSNGDAGFKSMEIGRQFSGSVFVDALGNVSEEVVINEAGWGDFKVNGGSVSVWVKK